MLGGRRLLQWLKQTYCDDTAVVVPNLGQRLPLITLVRLWCCLQDAPAAWIPSLFELVGGLLVLLLKLFFEHTAVGRKMCAAKQLAEHLAEQQLQQADVGKAQEAHSENGDRPDKVPVTPRTHMRNSLSAYGSGRFASIYNQAFSLPTTPRGSHCGASVASQRSLGPGAHTASGQQRSVELHVSTAGLSEDAAGIVLQVSDSASSKAGQLQQAELPGSPKCVLRLPTHRLRASAAGQLSTAGASPAAALHHEAVSTEPGVSWQGSFGDHSSHT